MTLSIEYIIFTYVIHAQFHVCIMTIQFEWHISPKLAKTISLTRAKKPYHLVSHPTWPISSLGWKSCITTFTRLHIFSRVQHRLLLVVNFPVTFNWFCLLCCCQIWPSAWFGDGISNCRFTGIAHIARKDFQLLLVVKACEILSPYHALSHI